MSELFQLREAEELDFGIYRVIKRHNRQVRAFLGEIVEENGQPVLRGGELAGILEQAFQQIDSETRNERKAQLQCMADGLGIKTHWPVEEREQYLIGVEKIPAMRQQVVDYRNLREELESTYSATADRSETLNRLYEFFSRHYQDGDFIVQRRYGRNGARYIKSSGEDTEFHWATEGMYYIKSGDVFTDYPVRLSNGRHLVFCVDAETLHQTRAELKPTDKASYKLRAIQEKDGVIRVTLDYLKGAQKTRAQFDEIASQAAALSKVQPDEIARHLRRYIARNQSDFFIHKRLQEALDDDLDIFLKTDVLNADQLLADDAGHIPARALRVARAIRRIGRRINAFLGVLEDYRKRLWEKKKLVLSTRYVITLDRLDKLAGRAFVEANLAAILANAAQVTEWRALGLGEWARVEAVRREDGGFLPLPVDTLHFGEDFKWALLAAVTKDHPLDESLDGVVVHSDNWQALNTMQEKYGERVKCVYIDPPYNTGGDGFPYKDSYLHASWLAMISERLSMASRLLDQQAALFVSLDDHEQPAFRMLADQVYGRINFVATIIWQKIFSPKNSAKHFSEDHDYLLVYARNAERWQPELLPRTAEMEARYGNPDNDSRGAWTSGDLSARNPYSEGRYPITCPSGRVIPGPPPGRYWVISKSKFDKFESEGRIWWGENGDNMPRLKRFLAEVKQGRVPQTIWSYQQVGHTQDAKKELLAYTTLSENESVFQTPKPTALIRRVLALTTEAIGADEWVLDFFAGSGTTGHAVLAQNHADDGGRKFLLVECNAYFDTLLLPRLKRAARSPEWKETDRADGPGLFMRVQRLEQYEDTLENLAVAAGENQNLFAGPEALAYELDAEAKRLLFASSAFAAPFGLTLKRIAGADVETGPVDLVESLIYLLGLHVERLYREQGSVVITGALNRGRQTAAVFWRDNVPHGADWLQAKMAEHPADRYYTNDPARLSFPGVERFVAIETVFVDEMNGNG